jgi:hypothetical protein
MLSGFPAVSVYIANQPDHIDFTKVSTILIHMTYIWIHPSPGRALFVDDSNIPPCNLCGERVAKCREDDCTGGAE